MKNITLKVGGQTIDLGITRLRVQQQINEIPLAVLELQIPTDNSSSSDTLARKEVANLTAGAAVLIELDNKTLFSGYLTQKTLSLKGKIWSVQVEARHLLQKLAWLPRSRVFRQQDDGTILNSLLQQAGVKLTRKATTQLNSKHDQMVQFRLSDWRFIRSRLLSTNCWLLPDAASSSVTVAPLAEPATASHTLERYSDSSGYTLYDVELNFDHRFTADSMSLQGWDIATQQLSAVQKSTASAFQPWKAASSATEKVTPSLASQDYQLGFSYLPEPMLNTLSHSWLNYQQLAGVQGYILLAGTRDFQPGESVRLSEFGAGLDGTAILTGVTQRFDTAQGWRSELRIGMPADILQPAPAEPSLHVGTVAEFTADPQQLDRIPIYLPALNLNKEVIFARLGKPYASKASGFCFYPEPGDEVVIGFIESDPRYPVILDAMHNPVNTAPFSPDEKNNRKELIVTKENNVQALLINTEEKTLTLSAGENNFTLTNEGNINVDSPAELQFSAETITQQAKTSLSLKGGSQVEITSASINMKN